MTEWDPPRSKVTLFGMGAARRSRPRGFQGAPTRLFSFPALALIVLVYAVPLVWNLGTSFTDQTTFSSDTSFIGIENYLTLAGEEQFLNDLRVTLIFAALVVLIDNVLALGLALALARPTMFNKIFRTVLFVPVLISSLAAGYVFRAFLAPNGTLNSAISAVTGSPFGMEWLADPGWAIFFAAFVQSWRYFAVHMLIYIAALNAIPQELIQSSQIDGASWGQTFRYITWPFLAGAVTVNVVLTLTGGLQIFDVVVALTGGGPGRATELLNILVFQKFGQGDIGYSTTVSAVVVLLISALAFPVIALLRRREIQL